MNIVAHLTPCTPGSTVASARVARFICETLPEFNLIDSESGAVDALHYETNTLIIVNGPMAFCSFLRELAELVRRAKRVIFVQQDYTIMPPAQISTAESPFRKVFADLHLRPAFWTTVEKNIQQPGDEYINWNQLTYDLKELPPLYTQGNSIEHDRVLLYYGAYREKRGAMFMKYFYKTDYRVKVSTTTLRGKKFKAIDEKIEIVPPFTDLAVLPVCSASLYIEDPKSSVEFHSPANRFYEMLSAGIPLFFDKSSLPMLNKGGIQVPSAWVVNSKAELHDKMLSINLHQMRVEQRQMWDEDYVGQLRTRLQFLWTELNK